MMFFAYSEEVRAIALLFILLAGAVATDLIKKKIYNLWVLPGLAAGLVTAGLSGGAAGIRASFLSALLAFVILFPVYLIGGIGAGDVKLFAAAAAWLSPVEVCLCVLFSFIIGAVFSLAVAARERNIHRTIRFAVPILISVVFIFGGKL